MDVMGH
jgi:hypothetical protein